MAKHDDRLMEIEMVEFISKQTRDEPTSVAEMYFQEEAEVLAFCADRGLSCYLDEGNLVVETPHSGWWIVASDNRLKSDLYHKNDIPAKGMTDADPGFHRQEVCYGSLMEYLVYIAGHDEYRYRHPLEQHCIPKEPARKGTKRWRKEQKKLKNKSRREATAKVMEAFQSLQGSTNAK